MSTTSRITRNLATLAGTSILVLGFVASASAYECKAKPEGALATSQNAATAMHISRIAWANQVKQKFGLEWSVWSIASTPAQSCTNAGSGVQCMAVAKPCKYVVQ